MQSRNSYKRDFPGSLVVKTPCFHCSGYGVWSLVGGLRSHMLCGQKKENTCKSMADSYQCMAKTTTIL